MCQIIFLKSRKWSLLENKRTSGTSESHPILAAVNLIWKQSAHCMISSSDIRCSDIDVDNGRKLGQGFSRMAKKLELFIRQQL